jgi:predicted ATPase/class 3 adenylate cyclase
MPIFAFTDIEGSTGLWERHQGAMGPIIARHYEILHLIVEGRGGKIIKKTGDGIFALFPDEDPGQPSRALDCALELQRRFQAEAWPVIGELRVRIALHRGEAEEMGGDYYGPTANRTARLMSLGWGGQVLVSEDLYKTATLPAGAQWADLGLHQVKDLPEPQQVYGLLHPSLKLQEFPALKSLSSRPHNLPERLSPLVGRRRETQELAALLTGPQGRLITLLGGGGMGKSRLAVQAALENLAAFKHGANRVELEGLSSADELPGRIAASLKLATYRQQDPAQQVTEYLKDKELLLILDPCEQLVASAWIPKLLEACPGLRILACSRRRLNLHGGSILELQGLDYPEEVIPEGFSSGGCARFFVQQAQGFQPGFSLKPEDRGYFLRICRVLRGMPLGLELAAAWVRSVPLKVLAERLEQDPRFLSSERGDLSASHRSLQALFNASWALLGERERTALASLSVFSGFTSSAAQTAFRTAPEVLAALAEEGLLEKGEAGRYSLPPTVRFFAALNLAALGPKQEEALDLHARYFCRLLKERERNLLGFDQARVVAELRREFPNIQRAWDRAVDMAWGREMGQAARCLGLYTDMQGLARDWDGRMEKALQVWEAQAGAEGEAIAREEALSVQASLLCNRASYLFSLGKGVLARSSMEKSLGLFRKAGNRSGAAYALVRIAVFLGPEDERRRPALEEAISLYQGLNDANGTAWARRNLGYLLCLQGRVQEGQPLVEESLLVFRKVGNQREIGWSLNTLGQAALERGDLEAGAGHLREARDIFVGLGDLENAAWTLHRLGRLAMKQAHWEEARTSLEESLSLFGQIRHFRGRALVLRSLCDLCAAQGDLASAFQVLDRAMAEAKAAGDGTGQAGAMMQKGQLLAGQKNYAEALGLLQAAQAAFAAAASEQGQALALEAQGGVILAQGDALLARRCLEQGVQTFARSGLYDGEARVCVRLGDLDSAEGKAPAAEALYKKALRLSHQNKPGDYSLGALLGLAGLLTKAGRKLEGLQMALLCERALGAGMMPPSEPEFFADLGRRAQATLAQIGAKLMQSVIEEARAKMAKDDVRALLKDYVEKNWS